MTQAAKAQEPSMEEILASIRRIIADDDGAKPAAAKPEPKPEPPPVAKAPPPPPPPKPAPAPAPAAMKQDDIDAMLAGLDEPAAPEPPPAPEPEPDVLELTEAMQAPAASGFRKIDAQQDVVFDETPEPEPPPPPRMAEPPRPAPPPQSMPIGEHIVSSATAAAVDSAFNALAHTVLVQNAKTLEDLVKEMLRPMLQHWLDNNLPTLVERLVRAEIERVARGRG
jgi:uncharacterized protein